MAVPATRTPIFGEAEAVIFFAKLEVLNKAHHTPRPFTPEEEAILKSLGSTNNAWTNDPLVDIDSVAEGRRLGTLLWEHTSRVKTQDSKTFLIDVYFPKILIPSSQVDRIRVREGSRMQLKVLPFMKAAGETFWGLATNRGWARMRKASKGFGVGLGMS